MPECPVCGNPVSEKIPKGSSFNIDTIGSIHFCVGKNALYLHGRASDIDTSEFESYSRSRMKIEGSEY